MKLVRLFGLMGLLLSQLVACDSEETGTNASPEFVVVYTSMDEAKLAPVYEGFTAATGIRIQQVSGDFDRLLELMHDKQWRPAADIFLARDSATLWNAASESIFRPTYSGIIEKSVPARLRDADYLFNAFAIRANAIVFDNTRSDNVVPERYESLAGPEWSGKLCLTSSAESENIAWVSLLLERHGKREAEMIVRRMIGNLAAPVFDGVAELVAAVKSGRCGAAIADLQFAALHLSGHASPGVSLILPAAAGAGTQLDIVGAGVTRHAANPEGAVQFLEWLAGDDAQQTIARSGTGLPVSGAIKLLPPLDRYQAISPADINVSQLAALSGDAIALVERAHYP